MPCSESLTPTPSCHRPYFPPWQWASPVAQTVKHLPAMWETWVQSLGWEDPLEKEMATHSSTLAWKIPWKEEPGRPQSMGSQRVGHDRAPSLSLHARWPGAALPLGKGIHTTATDQGSWPPSPTEIDHGPDQQFRQHFIQATLQQLEREQTAGSLACSPTGGGELVPYTMWGEDCV